MRKLNYAISLLHILFIVNGLLIFIFLKKYTHIRIFDTTIDLSIANILYLFLLLVSILISKFYTRKDFLFIIGGLFLFQCIALVYICLAKLLPTNISSPLSKGSYNKIFDFVSIIIVPILTLVINLTVYLFKTKFKLGLYVSKHKLEKQDRVVYVLSGIFNTLIFVTNIITLKYVDILGFTVTCGVLSYPFTFLITDIVSEIVNEQKSRQIIYHGFIANIFIFISIFILTKLPESQYGNIYKKDLNILLIMTPGIILASFIAYIISQICDIKLFAFIRRLTREKYLWLRNNLATMISEVVDTLVFALIIWVIWPKLNLSDTIKPIPWKIWVNISVTEYFFKCLIALLDTFILYFLVYYLRRYLRISDKISNQFD